MNTLRKLLILSLFLVPAAHAQVAFDHFSTGFDLDGAHANVSCDRCHANGTFQGTPVDCVGCHSQYGSVLATAKPMNHMSSSDTCDDCHTTSAWMPVSFVDHTDVTGSCGSCHNGVQAAGKPPNHLPTRPGYSTMRA